MLEYFLKEANMCKKEKEKHLIGYATQRVSTNTSQLEYLFTFKYSYIQKVSTHQILIDFLQYT